MRRGSESGGGSFGRKIVPVTIFNFTDVYKRQDFFKKLPCEWIDCTDLTGVHGFCDVDSFVEIVRRSRKTRGKLRFIDCGNFHYVSYALQKNYKEPYDLIVLDHHADLLTSKFEGLLSCGNWIKQVLKENDSLKHVILIGVSDELADAVRTDYNDKVTIYPESKLPGKDWLKDFSDQLKEPVYLSIDKDVFSTSELTTDWDQGSMTLTQFRQIFELIRTKVPILAADICGEYNSISGGNRRIEESDKRNSKANERILNIFLEKKIYA